MRCWVRGGAAGLKHNRNQTPPRRWARRSPHDTQRAPFSPLCMFILRLDFYFVYPRISGMTGEIKRMRRRCRWEEENGRNPNTGTWHCRELLPHWIKTLGTNETTEGQDYKDYLFNYITLHFYEVDVPNSYSQIKGLNSIYSTIHPIHFFCIYCRFLNQSSGAVTLDFHVLCRGSIKFILLYNKCSALSVHLFFFLSVYLNDELSD